MIYLLNFLRAIINLLFPIRCVICNSYEFQSNVCEFCWEKLTFITKPYCAICSHPFEYENDDKAICGNCIQTKPNYDKAISILKYDDYSKDLIHNFKYKDQLHILNYFVSLMLNMGKDLIEQADIIIPVAMHKHKLLKRGYNQAALIAMNIAKNKKIKYLPQAIIKIVNTDSQAGLKKSQRIKNIKNSFKLNSKFINEIKGKRVLLIDDVITTGATIEECCKVLKFAEPSKLFVLTLAKRA